MMRPTEIIDYRSTNIIDYISKLIKSKKESQSQNLSKRISALIKAIPKFTQLRLQEITVFQEIAQANPEIKVKIPKEIAINTLNDDDETLLTLAVGLNDCTIVEELLEAKANPDSINNTGRRETALHTAGRFKENRDCSQVIVHKLIEAKADLTIEDYNGDTPLFSAIGGYHLKIVELLINAGAKLEYKATNGYSSKNKTAVGKLVDSRSNYSRPLSTLSLLLNKGAIIHHPIAMYKYLEQADQQYLQVLDCLKYLFQQWQKPLEVKDPNISEKDKQAMMEIWKPEIAEAYIQKLTEFHSAYKKLCSSKLKNASGQLLPNSVINIVMDYDEREVSVVSQDTIKFFKPATVDNAIQKVNDMLKKEESSEQTCSVM